MLSSTLYTKFPSVYYNDELATNITARVKFKDVVKKNMAVYYPYTIIEGERPDTLAFKYYDDATYSWLIFLANDITDPMFDWPLTNDLFNKMLVTKYGSVAEAQERTLFYRVEWASDDSSISQSTFDALPAGNKKYWTPVLGTNNKISSYQRAQVDWAIETNKLIKIAVTQTSDVDLNSDNIVYQLTSGETSAKGVVDGFDAAGLPILKHIEGVFVANKSLYIKQTTSDVVYGTIDAVTSLASNLTPIEENYWVPVSAYDYELEINESKKHIVLIDKIYLDVIEKDLRNLMTQ